MKHIINKDNYKGLDIGAKAKHLLILQNEGVNVPDLFCIGDSSFEEGRLGDEAQQEIEDYLDQAHQQVTSFSVRSSSNLEDDCQFSFAGQFETYLNVKKEDILKYIEKCYASRASTNALAYCKHMSIDPQQLKMNVIIQEMIDSEMSGVIFTANPQGLLNELVLVVGEGTGNYVVEDLVLVTTYYYNKTDKLFYYETKAPSPVLKEELFNEIIALSDKLEKQFGAYIDIEYAIKEDMVYILQVRPITTINAQSITVLDNSNIVESYPGITLPLTDSFVKEVYEGVFRGVAIRLLKDNRLVKKYDETFKSMVASANGRVYYQISNWYTMIKFLPFRNKIIPVWQEMLGVANKAYNDDVNSISFIQNIKVYFNAAYQSFKIQKGMKNLNEEFLKVRAYFDSQYAEEMKSEELIGLYRVLQKKLLKNWDITLFNDMYAFIYTGLLKRTIQKLGIPHYEIETNKYISGISNIESLKPIKALMHIAIDAFNNGYLDALASLKNEEEVRRYLKEDNDLTRRINRYIYDYGDRNLEELKLESLTFKTSPQLLISKIVEYCQDFEKLESIYATLNSQREEKLSDAILEQCHFIKKFIIHLYSKRAMRGISNRESSRLNRTRIYGMVRTLYLAIGNNFAKDNILEKKEDIFYLTKNEVFDVVQGTGLDLKTLIKSRKSEYRMYESIPSYSRLLFAGGVFNKKHANINAVKIAQSQSAMVGIPCSNGEVTGEVVVIADPTKQNVDVRGKIIVTKMTDPGWVFLLAMAKGIITEKGSLLSHTAIISRELNIPAIVGVKNVTNILKTGDIIILNGSTGEIERLEVSHD